MVKLKHKHDSVTLTLQPNRSANWRQNKIIFMVMTAFVMIIAIAWSVVGVWVILPFAGFEVGLLAFLMYRVSYFTYQKQIITIHSDTVVFQAGVYYPKRFHSFCKDKLSVKTIEAQSEFEQTQITLDDGQTHFRNVVDLAELVRKISISRRLVAGTTKTIRAP